MSNTEGIKPYSDLAHEAKECGGPDKLKEAWAEIYKEIGRSEQKERDIKTTCLIGFLAFAGGCVVIKITDIYNNYQSKKQMKLQKDADIIDERIMKLEEKEGQE